MSIISARREKKSVVMRQELRAFRARTNEPAPLSKDAVRRVTKNSVEYGGIVIGTRAKDRNGSDFGNRPNSAGCGARRV